MRHLSESLKETSSLAKKFLKDIQNISDDDKATVVGLFGDLGAGKTTFTKALAKELGVKETVTSPTFVIQKKYKLFNGGRFSKMVHVDAYRLENANELAVLDWDHILKKRTNFVCVEWPEKVAEALPENMVIVRLSVVNETERSIDW